MTIYDTSPAPYVDFDLSVPVKYAMFDLNATGVQLMATPVVFMGFAIKNASGSATAELDIYSATGASGTPLLPIDLAANESTREWFGDRGILFPTGIYLNVSSGEVKGAVFYVPMSGLTSGAV